MVGEDATFGFWKAAPTNPDATPEFSGPGIAVVSAAPGAQTESSGFGIAAIGVLSETNPNGKETFQK